MTTHRAYCAASGCAKSPVRLSRLIPWTLLAACAPLYAATPASGTLTPASAPLTYTAGPFVASNSTGDVADQPQCNPQAHVECDSYLLTVNLPAGFANNKVKVSLSWDAGSLSDYDLYVYSGDTTAATGTQPPADKGDAITTNNPETVSFLAPAGASTTYTIKVVPYTATPGETPAATIELLPGDGGGSGGGGGGGGQSCSIPAGVRP